MNKKRLLIDTNVYLSALLFGGNPRQVVEQALLKGYVIVISEEIYTEMRRVIASKFPGFRGEYKLYEAMLESYAVQVQLGEMTVDVCRDKKDNMILETAMVGDVELIVTGDQDLLALRSYSGIDIIAPANLVKKFFTE